MNPKEPDTDEDKTGSQQRGFGSVSKSLAKRVVRYRISRSTWINDTMEIFRPMAKKMKQRATRVRLNKKYAHSDRPAVRFHSPGRLDRPNDVIAPMVALDISGSVSWRQKQAYAGEISKLVPLLKEFRVDIPILQADSRVMKLEGLEPKKVEKRKVDPEIATKLGIAQEFVAGEEYEIPYFDIARLKPENLRIGEGGGTEFTDALLVAEQLYRQKKISGVIFCTDGFGSPAITDQRLTVPVQWLVFVDMTDERLEKLTEEFINGHLKEYTEAMKGACRHARLSFVPVNYGSDAAV